MQRNWGGFCPLPQQEEGVSSSLLSSGKSLRGTRLPFSTLVSPSLWQRRLRIIYSFFLTWNVPSPPCLICRTFKILGQGGEYEAKAVGGRGHDTGLHGMEIMPGFFGADEQIPQGTTYQELERRRWERTSQDSGYGGYSFTLFLHSAPCSVICGTWSQC